MYTGLRDLDDYARVLRRTTWAGGLERIAEAMIDSLRGSTPMAQLVRAPIRSTIPHRPEMHPRKPR